MDANRWNQIQEVLLAVDACATEERQALIDARCGSDLELRQQILSLLSASQAASSFFDGLLSRAVGPRAGPAVEDPFAPGSRIGPYRVRERIGGGGMGTVYRATDERLKRDVALKVPARHLLDDPLQVARFRREAQVLAALNHPSIAVIHDLEEAEGGVVLVLEDVIRGCLQRSLSRRFGDASVVREALLGTAGRASVGAANPPPSPPSGQATLDPLQAPALQQVIRFCTSSDAVRIAYATVGKGRTIVKAANWLNHLEYDWESPVWRHLLHALAREWHLIRYDERGTGLSDREVEDISLRAFVLDLEAVVEAAAPERFVLFGVCQGCAVSIVYAVEHPDRVSHLILFGGYARGAAFRESAPEAVDALATVLRHGWGKDNPACRQIFTSWMIPGATREQMDWFNDLQRLTASPEDGVPLAPHLRSHRRPGPPPQGPGAHPGHPCPRRGRGFVRGRQTPGP